MSRRRKTSGDAGSVILVLLIGALFALAKIIYIASIWYGLLIIFPFMYYNFWGAKKLNDNKDFYIKTREELSSLKDEANAIDLAHSNRPKTQRGDYDERSTEGKLANQSLRRISGAIYQSDNRLEKMVTPYKMAESFRAALLAYFIAVVLLSYWKVESTLIPILCVVTSTICGLIARQVIGHSQPFKELPQLGVSTSIAVFLMWIIGCIYSYTLYEKQEYSTGGAVTPSVIDSPSIPDQIPKAPESPETTESKSKSDLSTSINPPSNIEGGENTEVSRSTAENSILPIENKNGFLTRPVLARSAIGSEAFTGVSLANGKEVTVTGVSSDNGWYEITYKGANGKLYVPIDSIAIFSN